MCGIVGFSGSQNTTNLKSMMDSITHRGPNGEAMLQTEIASFGMRRLSIIDLVTPNIYPVWDQDHKFAAVFNGEIYNYKSIRTQLKQMGYTFTTESDSEVIVNGYAAWGIDFISKLRGMFAIALYDSVQNKCYLIRDRLGIKPLYYAESEGRLVFASEIKAIFAGWSQLSREADEVSVTKFLLTRVHDDTKRTFFKNVKRIMPGHYMEIDALGNFTTTRYWFPKASTEFKSTKPDSEYVLELKNKLIESVDLHLISDVPLGVNLSGGLDSSGVVCLANKLLNEGRDLHTNHKLITFSAVHPGETIDETKWIDEVLTYTGATSVRIAPDLNTFWNEINEWVYFQEEPTISTAPYAYYTVMREAKKHVTVLLSGQGGDELFAGYIPYFMSYITTAADANAFWNILKESVLGLDLYGDFIKQKINQQLKKNTRLSVNNLINADLVKDIPDSDISFKNRRNLNSRLFEDLTASTVPNLLRYEDKNAMANSLESRVPFLDHELVQMAMQIPASLKIKNGWNRWVYREAMKGLMPEKIRKRRSKIGFVNSEWEWLQAKADFIKEIFSSDQFKSRPYWNAEQVLTEFTAWVNGEKWGDGLMFWRILSVELWHRNYVDSFKVLVK